MSEAKKMDEKEFLEVLETWQGDARLYALASRLGIELTTQEEEPLSCPFCGKLPLTFEDGREGGWWVRCSGCDIKLPGMEAVLFRTKAQAIAAWNRRHQPQKTTPGEVHLFDGDDMKTIAIPTREGCCKHGALMTSACRECELEEEEENNG